MVHREGALEPVPGDDAIAQGQPRVVDEHIEAWERDVELGGHRLDRLSR